MLEARSRNWCSSVDIVTWLWEWLLGKHGSILGRRTSLLPNVQNSSGAKCVPEGSLEGSKVAGSWSWPVSRLWLYTSTPPHVFRSYWAHHEEWVRFCSRLITLLLFAVDYVTLFAVDYVTFVRGWLCYFCSRLITLLLFMVDCVTCRARMLCR